MDEKESMREKSEQVASRRHRAGEMQVLAAPPLASFHVATQLWQRIKWMRGPPPPLGNSVELELLAVAAQRAGVFIRLALRRVVAPPFTRVIRLIN